MTTAPARALLGVPLAPRWAALGPDLRALAAGLERELAPLRDHPWPVPREKAQLTRHGGRCPHDSTPLTMDPWSPTRHRCPSCGTVLAGGDHDAWWAMGAQLWCAERVLHAALLGGLQQRADLLTLAGSGLTQLTAAWPTYPNRDNALGPSRPFFSTYLESVWLLTAALAARVLQQHPAHAGPAERFAQAVAPASRALVASFVEGGSNRQVWHVAARLAVADLLDDQREWERALHAPCGLVWLLEHGLLPDGAWFEGENYHLFAHRGLWFGITLAESRGASLPEALVARFDRGFCTPLRGVLPDGTFPARRDSRYGVSVHQWRFAEWCELGLARRYEPELAGWLHRLYHSTHPAGDTGRARSTAEIERDEPPCALQRSDLGWRTLLHARVAPWPAPLAVSAPSVLLPASGLAVLRRDAGRLYVALEGGPTGGGHGHPDRLALALQDGPERVLEDPGTGSYVERSLHWYRSTLAHNAPLVDGASQQPVPTRVCAFESRSGMGWMQVEAPELAPGVRVVRSVALCDEHVVDLLQWTAERELQLDLPLHAPVEPAVALAWRAGLPGGAGGLEDGFDFLEQVAYAELPDHDVLAWHATGASRATAWSAIGRLVAPPDGARSTIWRAMAPGPPRTGLRRMHWLRVPAATGRIVTVWSLRGAVHTVRVESVALIEDGAEAFEITVECRDGTAVRHRPSADGWIVGLRSGSGRSRVCLGGRLPDPGAAAILAAPNGSANAPWPDRGLLVPTADGVRHELGESHYRRSEASWRDAGAPRVFVTLRATPASLEVTVEQPARAPVVPPAGAENRFDNERTDVHADGVQCHVGRPGAPSWCGAWLLVPEPASGAVRVTALHHRPPAGGPPDPDAEWCRAGDGWRLVARLPLAWLRTCADAHGEVSFDVLVNERTPDRQRRRGQFVLSGAAGEWVYLRGDRHDPARALRVRLPVVASPSPVESA
jgi:hypothetical protein